MDILILRRMDNSIRIKKAVPVIGSGLLRIKML